jgi:hypothetical protein
LVNRLQKGASGQNARDFHACVSGQLRRRPLQPRRRRFTFVRGFSPVRGVPPGIRIAEGIGPSDISLHLADASCELDPQTGFRAPSDHVEDVHGLLLSDAIHTTDALFETRGRPRQLEIHDHRAALLKVEAFAGRVRREQHRDVSARKRLERGKARAARKAPVKNEGCESQ